MPPFAQDGFESFGRVMGCDHVIRPLGAACHDRWPVWRCADQAQNQRRELVSAVAFYCFSWPGSDRSFALTFLDLLTRPTFPWPLNLIVDQMVAAAGTR